MYQTNTIRIKNNKPNNTTTHVRNLFFIGILLVCLLLSILPNAFFLDLLHTGTRKTIRLTNNNKFKITSIFPQHVLFTTFKSFNLITENSLTSIENLLNDEHQRIFLYIFVDIQNITMIRDYYHYHHHHTINNKNLPNVNLIPIPRTNEYGYPILKDMILFILNHHHNNNKIDTLTYFNSDLIFSERFVNVADLLMEAVFQGKINSRFLAVGQRINVKACYCQENEKFDGSLSRFNEMLSMGNKFVSNAQDYFIMSPSLFNFQNLPDLVVGRIFYDNYLTARAQMDGERYISTIDVSALNPVIHRIGSK
jgi:hypothetical protein